LRTQKPRSIIYANVKVVGQVKFNEILIELCVRSNKATLCAAAAISGVLVVNLDKASLLQPTEIKWGDG